MNPKKKIEISPSLSSALHIAALVASNVRCNCYFAGASPHPHAVATASSHLRKSRCVFEQSYQVCIILLRLLHRRTPARLLKTPALTVILRLLKSKDTKAQASLLYRD
ncbi:hypothetical protein SESBI_06101 [Sesbania bispinosa]|nr:hypothetical protein SESBI_06101 [Sesbania bispinosa]